MFLPKLPNLRSDLLVVLLRPSRAGVKPSDKLCVYNFEEVGLRATTVQFRQNRACFRFILIAVLVKIETYPNRVVLIEERGDGIEQTSVFRFESATVFENFIACFGHVVRREYRRSSIKVRMSHVSGQVHLRLNQV